MTRVPPTQAALNAAQDARLVAAAINSGPTVAVLKAAEASARRLAAAMPGILAELAARQAIAREAEKQQRKDQRIIGRDAAKVAERSQVRPVNCPFAIPAMEAA